ncbi:helix-hairpin-helix domain-containing protein [Asaia siamensis]|uniref:Rad51 domain protein n=1 Tax=Asaia siamensis TaxID=110479 RepID=A0ABQ1L6E5_9PROT|nr:helix-hairpin-helix domain-containing protein [Asaia siamensis]GBR09316.1 hypothetical protein AA0323_2425 [Asaia siamensis NRIC 0323]GGC20381.1 Rad51 domain protein [Asaia siamensis]
MPFPESERQLLLAGKGVGPTVLQRIEENGIHCLADLANQTAQALCYRIAAKLGATCWSNSPQARSAIAAAIEIAQSDVHNAGPHKSL